MSNTTQLAAAGIGGFRTFESASRIRREAFRLELLFLDCDITKSPQYLELANYIDALNFSCLTYTPRSNYLAVHEKTIAALNEILEKHSKIFQAGFIKKAKSVNASMRERGMPEMVLNPNDIRTLFINSEIELQDLLPKKLQPTLSAFKEGFSAIRSPMTIIFSVSMIGYFMGENVRQSITNFIMGQGIGLHILLFGALLVYGFYCALVKYKSVVEEKQHSEIELAHNLKKTMHAAIAKVVGDQIRLYKSTLERAIMAS